MNDSLLIAVDFDGTIVEDGYPKIGKPMPFALETLKMIIKDGHRIVLWTYRHGEKLEEAVNFLKSNNVRIYAVNSSFPEEKYTTNLASRKINADIFIDDRNFGGFPGWGCIYQNLKGEKNELLKNQKVIFLVVYFLKYQ